MDDIAIGDTVICIRAGIRNKFLKEGIDYFVTDVKEYHIQLKGSEVYWQKNRFKIKK